MEEKEAGRRFPYFRPAGMFAPALCPLLDPLPSCALVVSSFIPFTIPHPSTFLPTTGNLSSKKNNIRANGTVVIHADMIDTRVNIFRIRYRKQVVIAL